MPLDAIACEKQFLDHAAPVWRLLQPPHRGRFLTTAALADHARALGIMPTVIDAQALRLSSPPPSANPGAGPAAFVVSIGDTKVARRLGYRRFAFMEHGAGQAYIGQPGPMQRHPSYAGGADREDTELFLTPNDYSADLFRKAYPSAAVEVVGCPRLAYLPARALGPGPMVAITFHWPARVCPEAETALGTYIGVLGALAAAYPGHIIGHAHPKADWPERMQRVYAKAGIPFVADFDEVCRRADVLVFDNTSAGFEFAATGRPVVVLNGSGYRKEVRHGLRFWDAASVGIQVDEPSQLLPAIEEALADPAPRRTAREAALDLVYPIRHGAAERAAEALSRWAEPDMAVARAA